MRIVIFGDSLIMPRPLLDEPSRTQYEDVYAWQIRNKLKNEHEIDICYMGGLDTEDAITWAEQMVAYKRPDLVIFHIGINDCVPRLFKKNSKSILLNRVFKKLTFNGGMWLLSKYRYQVTRYIKKTYVTKMQFRDNLNKIVVKIQQLNQSVQVMAISISRTSPHLAQRSFAINSNIDEYNMILQQFFGDGYVDVNSILPNEQLLIEDGIHLTKEAHTLLAERLIAEIQRRS